MSSVPDLLRRFVPAPHVCNVPAGESYLRLETNDPSIVTAMRGVASPSDDKGRAFYSWRLIRDDQTPRGGRKVTILTSGALSTLLLGVGTIVAVDRQQREVLGFIASDVSDQEFVTILLPLITKLSTESHPVAAESALL